MGYPRRPTKSGDCQKCGVFRISLHREHIIPAFENGPDTEDNIQYICANCHEDKTREDMKRFRHTPESKVKCGLANRGVGRHNTPHTPETCVKISAGVSAAQTGRFSPRNGKVYSEGYKRRLIQQGLEDRLQFEKGD